MKKIVIARLPPTLPSHAADSRTRRPIRSSTRSAVPSAGRSRLRRPARRCPHHGRARPSGSPHSVAAVRADRSEERRVGKEGVSLGRFWGSPYTYKKITYWSQSDEL